MPSADESLMGLDDFLLKAITKMLIGLSTTFRGRHQQEGLLPNQAGWYKFYKGFSMARNVIGEEENQIKIRGVKAFRTVGRRRRRVDLLSFLNKLITDVGGRYYAVRGLEHKIVPSRQDLGLTKREGKLILSSLRKIRRDLEEAREIVEDEDNIELLRVHRMKVPAE